MSEPKPRRWFQIHLSTAVVVMIASGLMIGINIYLPQGAIYDLNYPPLAGFPIAFVGKRGGSIHFFLGAFLFNLGFWIVVLGYIFYVCERRFTDKRSVVTGADERHPQEAVVNSEHRPRRWFQIHLNTAVAVMLAAGILLYLNLCPRIVWHLSPNGGDGRWQVWGWPFAARIQAVDYLECWTSEQTFEIFIAGNIFISIILLFGFAFILEFLIRRREARTL